MLKKRQFKSFICMFITFLMVFTSVDTGILGMKQVFAETVKEDSKSLHDESVEKSNASIGVQNLQNGQEFTNPRIGFLAWADNASDEDFIVKLNDEILEENEFRRGAYNGTLKPGKNIVTIEAKDENGNVAKETYTVTYKLDEPKDTEKPVIEVEGLENGQKVSNKEVSFKVTVTDNVDKDIEPIVKLNNEVVTETNGEYKVTLIDGENIITIEATDAARNKADGTYTLTYIKLVDKDKLRKQVEEAIEKASKVAVNKGYNNSDWGVIGLARAGKTDDIASDYLQKTEKDLKKLGFSSKLTDLERITLGVLAAGGDPTNIAGCNLIKQIYSADLYSQRINDIVFGLIALDAGEYYVPFDARCNRDKLIEEILDRECDDGGWSYGGDEADPDMTGMVMTALSPYNNDKYPKVQKAIQKAVECLSSIQKDSGAYVSWGNENSESCAQVIMGLCTNGIDPTEVRFTKNGKNVVDALLNFEVDGGGFDHLLGNRKHVNDMATQQALYALDQYIFFEDKKGSIYQWGKQDTSGDKTVNLRIEGKDKVIVSNTDFVVKGDNVTVKDVVEQVLKSKGITYEKNSTGFKTIDSQVANESKWLCSIENGSIIENMTSRYVNNYENIVVYLGKDPKDFTYTWIECSKASVFKPQEIEVFTASDVELNVKGCKNNNYYMIDNITDATVYVNGQQYKKDGKNVVTDDSGKVTFNFDKPGNYEITTQKDNMRSGNFLIKVVEDTEPPTVEFWPENIEERIEKDQVEQIAITPKDNKDDSKDVKIFVKLNGKELKPDKIREWSGGLEFNDVVLDKYDNLFEVTVTDKSGNTQIVKEHVINKNKPEEKEDTEEPVIKLEGLKDGQEVSEKELSFKVAVTDNVDKDIKPIVKLNNQVVTGTNGEYKVTLTDGENTIIVEATDEAGNKADETYKVNYKKIEETPFEFDASTGTITGYKEKNVPENLVIPAEINGVKVKKIGYKAFYYSNYGGQISTQIKTLELPEGLEVIDGWAFQGNALEKLTLPNSLTELKERAFYGNQLKEIKLSENIKSIGADVFYNNKLKTITIPKNVKEIGASAFKQNLLEIVNLPEGLESIGKQAFALNNIDKIIIPKSVKILPTVNNQGIVWRNFIDASKDRDNQIQRYTKVYGNSNATDENTSGIVNPTSVTIKYVDEKGTALKASKTVVGKELKKLQSKKEGYKIVYEIVDGSNEYLTDYNTRSNNYKDYEHMGDLGGNYYRIGETYEFEAEEIKNYEKPDNKTVKLEQKDNELKFVYKSSGKVDEPEQPKDAEKPVIKVEDLKNGQEVSEKELGFKVIVTDNVDKDIKPVVKLNDEVVTGTDGEYKVTLTDGENTITIEAKDAAGNKADETYKVIYEAEDTTIKEPFKIKVRVEANDHTIVKPVEVTINDLNLSKYGIKTKFTEPKPIHAIIKALESVGIDCTDSQKGLDHGGGSYITMIDGLKTLSTGKNDGWMYYVDNKFANEGVATFEILDAKSIVVFFQEDYTKNTYSWFDKEEVTVKSGENVKLKLTGNSYDMWTNETKTGGVDGATILVNEKEYKLNDEIVKTDVDGKVSLTFNEPGTYHISAEKKDLKTGKRILTRPYCKVIVEEQEKPEEPVVEPEQPEKFVAKRIGKGSLKKGSSTEVEFKIKNKLEKDEEVTLAVVLYDKKTNEMINYSYVKKVLKEGEIESFAGGFTIPEKGDYVVKAIICDSLDKKEDKMNILVDPVKIAVE